MVVHKYIVHVLDRNSEGPILNDFEGKNNAEVDKFFEKLINKVAKDDDLRKAVFKDYSDNFNGLLLKNMNNYYNFYTLVILKMQILKI